MDKSKLKFKNLEYSDIDSCLQIMQENYSEVKESFWSNVLLKDLSEIINEDKLYHSNGIVLVYNEAIVGFGCYFQSKMGHDIYELPWVNIRKDYQNMGLGKKLITELEENISKKHTKNAADFIIMFETDKSFFYKKLGYETIYEIADEHIMAKTIKYR